MPASAPAPAESNPAASGDNDDAAAAAAAAGTPSIAAPVLGTSIYALPAPTRTGGASSTQRPLSILFVCLGNICRSPLAHGLLTHLVTAVARATPSLQTPSPIPPLPSSTSSLSPPSRRPPPQQASQPSPPLLTISSAGTAGYHAGSSPDPRTLGVLALHGIRDFRHGARRVTRRDFAEHDYILAMDRENLEDLGAMRDGAVQRDPAAAKARLQLFGEYGAFAALTEAEAEMEEISRQRSNVYEDEDQDAEDSGVLDVDDPYYGGDEGFEIAFQRCLRFSRGFLKAVLGVEVEMDRKGNVTVIGEPGL